MSSFVLLNIKSHQTSLFLCKQALFPVVPLHLAASNVLPPGLSWGRFMESKRQLRCHHLHEVPSDFLKRNRCPSSLCLLSEFLLEYFSYCATASLCVSAHSTQQTTDPLCPRSTSCEENGYGCRSVRLRLESDSHLCIILCPVSAPSLDGGAESAKSDRCRSGGQMGAGGKPSHRHELDVCPQTLLPVGPKYFCLEEST